MTRRHDLIAATLLVLLGIAMRWPGMMNELWFDEVWSLHNAIEARSWVEVFTAFKIDNNHPLNSLWLHLVGPGASALVYRLLSFGSGIASVGVAFAIGRRDHPVLARSMALLVAMSFFVAYYASEARGYAPVAFFTLLAWYCLQRYLDEQSLRPAIGCCLCAVAGVLSHSTFVEYFIAAWLWCDVVAQRRTRDVRAATQITLVAFGPAALMLSVIYFVTIRGTAIAGGPPTSLGLTIAETLSLLVGGPAHGVVSIVVALAVATGVAISITMLYRARCDRWIMYAVAIVAAPALFLVVQPAAATYPRYFMVPALFVLLVLAELLAMAWNAAGAWRLAAIAAVSGVTIGCLVQQRELVALGRGRYDRAIHEMLRSNLTPATVGSASEFTQHDFRVSMMVDYHLERQDARARLRYVDEAHYPDTGTTWLIRERFYESPPADARFIDARGNVYALDASYGSASLAGLTWSVYRRIGERSAP